MKTLPLLLILALVACKKDATPVQPVPNEPQAPMYPLKVGNKWTIQAANYDSLGNVTSTRSLPIEVYSDTLIQNERWFVGAWIYANRTDGVYDYRPETSIPINLRYKYPATVGTTYAYRLAQVRVMSVADTITVQAGTFVCYRYRFSQEGDPYYADEYIAPGVGLIKEEGYHKLPSGRIYKYLNYNLIWFSLQ